MVIRHEQPEEPRPISPHIDLAETHSDRQMIDAFADSYMQAGEALRGFGVPPGHELAGQVVDIDGNKHDVRFDDIESIEEHPDKPQWRRVALIGGAALVVTVGGLVAARKKLGQRKIS